MHLMMSDPLTCCVDDPLAAYGYSLPQELIAQKPAKRRVKARLLVLEPGGGLSHSRVFRLLDRLAPGDLLVMNDTRVVPARLLGRRDTGGKAELLLLNPASPRAREAGGAELHEALLKPGRRLGPGSSFGLAARPEIRVEVVSRGEKGKALVRLPQSGLSLAEAWGETPLPPYIKRTHGPYPEDRRRYQTVYAANPGAVAAPTAGLHLSRELLRALGKRGVQTARVTLHVGYGTFAEPDPADLARGRLHAEWVEVGENTARMVRETRLAGKKVIAVGTTSLRALEWAAADGEIKPRTGWCDILIAPGHGFAAITGLLTNFHLPRTTLLMLVAALAGRQRVLAAYAEAIKEKYRFYSYGDAMLIL